MVYRMCKKRILKQYNKNTDHEKFKNESWMGAQGWFSEMRDKILVQ